MGGNRRGENLRGPRAVERAGLSPAPCRSSDVYTRFYSFKAQGNISLHLGPAFQCYLQTPNFSLPFFALLALVGSFAMRRVTHSIGIRGCDFEECSYFQHNPTPALQGVQEHSSAGQQMHQQLVVVRLCLVPSCSNQDVSLLIYSRALV